MPVEPPPCPWLFPDFTDPGEDADCPTTSSAAGADLAPGTLLAAYRAGVFPMPLGDRGRRR